MDQDPHAEGRGAARHLPADAPIAQDQQGLAVDLPRREAVAEIPGARAHRAVISGPAFHRGQQQIERVLGDGDRIDRADHRERNPAGVQRGEIDIVIADAMTRNDLEMSGGGDRFARQRARADHDAVGRAGTFQQRCRRRRLQGLDRDSGTLPQQRQPGGMDLVDDEDPRHVRGAPGGTGKRNWSRGLRACSSPLVLIELGTIILSRPYRLSIVSLLVAAR